MEKINIKLLGPVEKWPYRVSLKNISKHFYNEHSGQFEFYPTSPTIFGKGFTDTNLLIMFGEYFSENDLWINLPDLTCFFALNTHLVDFEKRSIFLNEEIRNNDKLLIAMYSPSDHEECASNAKIDDVIKHFNKFRFSVRSSSSTMIRLETQGNRLHEEYQSVDLDQLVHYREKFFAYFFGVQLQLTPSSELRYFLGVNFFLEFGAHLPSFEYFLTAELLNANEYDGLISANKKEQVLAYVKFMRDYEGFKLSDPFKIHIVPNEHFKKVIDSFLTNFLPFEYASVIQILFSPEKHHEPVMFIGKGSRLIAIILKMEEVGIVKVKSINKWLILNFAYYDPKKAKASFLTDSICRNVKGRGQTIDYSDPTWQALKEYQVNLEHESR